MHINDNLFQNLDSTALSALSTVSSSNSCRLYQRIKVGTQQSGDQSPQYTARLLMLQLRKEYVLQVDISTKQILSGFKCDIEVSFKINRTLTGQSQQIGDITGIQFTCRKWERKHVFLYVPDDDKHKHIQHLQSLQKNLGRNYIIQEGFHQIYRAIKKIGKGVTASVYKALRLTDHKEVAVKSFKKQLYYKVDNGRGKVAFQKQFKVLTEMRCKYLCKLISVYESQNSIYIVMDILDKSLYNYLKLNGFPKLEAAKQMMVKLLIGLEHMHKKGYMHRDLKLQNIMVSESGSVVQPVIIDYGLAENPSSPAFLYVKCGTPGYVAPQILGLRPNQIPSPPYSQACDVFSLGVIFYILLVGKTLFSGNDQKQVVKLNRQCNIDYDFKDVERLTDQMKDLLRKMLRKQPNQRSTVQQLLGHNFFKQVGILKEYQSRSTSISMEDVQQNLL